MGQSPPANSTQSYLSLPVAPKYSAQGGQTPNHPPLSFIFFIISMTKKILTNESILVYIKDSHGGHVLHEGGPLVAFLWKHEPKGRTLVEQWIFLEYFKSLFIQNV